MRVAPLKKEVDMEIEEGQVQGQEPDVPYKKQKIPKAMREALWIYRNPVFFTVKCNTTWCPNKITPFNFQAGHNIPESKGGATSLDNLVTLCSRCNLSMGNRYTFDEWCKISKVPKPIRQGWSFSCIGVQNVTIPSKV